MPNEPETTENDSRDKLIADLRREVSSLQKQLKALKTQGQEDRVVFQGVTYPIIGDFRADNTFAEVKRGHCPEGITLIAISRVH